MIPTSPLHRRPETAADDPELLLIVEDSRGDRIALEYGIGRRFPRHRVEAAESLAAARAVLDAKEVSVAVVDHLLGDGSGLDLVEAYPAVSFIVVTGTGSERVAAGALRSGAFDYVIKEDGHRHLEQAARAIEAALAHRRTRGESSPWPARHPGTDLVRFGDFELDLLRHELRESGEPRAVHRTPMRLLVHLVRNADRTVPKDELLEKVWEGTVVSDMAIASALKELRHLLRDDGARQQMIETRRGSGYRFVAPLSVAADALAGGVSSTERPSPAMLPLENRSNDPAHDYSALGMTVAQAIAREIRLALTPRESVQLDRPTSVDPLAHDAFLMGRFQYRIYSRESVAAALGHFLRAIERSPRYAAAHVEVAECYEALCLPGEP